MSRVSGTGRRLLDDLEQLCRKDGISNLYLWADATCHVSYYEKNGFEMMARFENGMLSDKPALDVCIQKASELIQVGQRFADGAPRRWGRTIRRGTGSAGFRLLRYRFRQCGSG